MMREPSLLALEKHNNSEKLRSYLSPGSENHEICVGHVVNKCWLTLSAILKKNVKAVVTQHILHTMSSCDEEKQHTHHLQKKKREVPAGSDLCCTYS